MRYKQKRKLNIDKSEISCLKCGKVCKGERSLKSHITQIHINKAKSGIKRGRPLGVNAWNKGLTKETSDKVKQIGLTISEKIKSGEIVPGFLGKKHNDDSKERISKKLSLNNKGGRCKWYEVEGVKVQGTWERDIAIQLTNMGITWEKVKQTSHLITYIKNGKTHRYCPDFYLKEVDIYLEIKGHWWGEDKHKMDLVIKQNPNINIKIIEREEFKKIMDGELVW